MTHNPYGIGVTKAAPPQPAPWEQAAEEAQTGAAPFDICGPLPDGTTVLEASAGTGKTYTIAALAARFIAEGHVTLAEIMMVTFSRAATNELRMRVRERLVATERGLAAALRAHANGTEPAAAVGSDTVTQLLADTEPDELGRRRERLARALAEFDEATIATTHEFCQRMLSGLGVLGDVERDQHFVEDLTALTEEVASDLYLQHFADADRKPPFPLFPPDPDWSRDESVPALTLANSVVRSPSAGLVPDPGAADDPVAARQVRYALAVRTEVERRKRLQRLHTYDDMLLRLQSSLADPDHGEAAAARLRRRYRVVLVDEFQDTDPVQWDIVRRAFHGHARLILIGDPKQAIYAFRGADVQSYLAAVAESGRVATLGTNWRSDAALVDALDVLIGRAALGDPRIVAHPVRAHHQERRLHTNDPADATPVRLRVRSGADEKPLPPVGRVRPEITADLVDDVTRVLSGGHRISVDDDQHDDDQRDGGTRVLRPSDVAVLVRSNRRGEEIRSALAAAGVPAVLSGATSVYATDIAQEWLTLLQALEQPHQSQVRKAALTCFVGWDFVRLATVDDDELTDLTMMIRSWSRIIRDHGVAAALESITARTALTRRILALEGGERVLTDLRHIGQSLHAIRSAGQLAVTGLITWLQERMAEATASGADERTRRLETDADAVQVMTVHGSKGLEFSHVYLPDAWDRHVPDDKGQVLRLHDPTPGGGGDIVLDVGGQRATGRRERLVRSQEEDAGDDLRLLYVGLTRARHQVVTWWAPTRNTTASALHRLLQGPRREGVEPDAGYPVDATPFGCAHLDSALFSVESMDAPRAGTDPDRADPDWATAVDPESLDLRRFTRGLDLVWRRTSYSALTAAVHGIDLRGPGVGSEAEPHKEDDEPATDLPPGEATSYVGGDFDRPSPMAELPRGAAFGTAVHAIFEEVDPQASDLAAEVLTETRRSLVRLPGAEFTAEQLAESLLPSLRTPLGPLALGRRLCDIPADDRLPELDFEFPLAGGDRRPGAHGVAPDGVWGPTLARVGDLLRRHLPADDPLAPYPDRLQHPLLAAEQLRGFLIGSIDAVLRVRDDDGTPRYLVVDYKTNWLGPLTQPDLRLGHYAPPLLAEAMMEAHYPLQALLYGVAVHRFLRWRQTDYAPERHLGGVLYLFVRGMAGADTPVVDGVPCGVFSWLPPAELITDLSTLLADTGALPDPEGDVQ
ncbi:MAG: UvrD-helicase domain-containing protein [Propionibacteriaceae bacterium]